MKRLWILLLAAVLLLGCGGKAGNRYSSSVFDATLPDAFEPVGQAGITCFAPHGDPLLSSSITFYSTELNWYFDQFTESEYESALKELCGYESLNLRRIEHVKVDGYDAHRLDCSVQIDQGTHDLIIYAVNADHTYFFTLLNRDTDSFVGAFDEMMKTIRIKGMTE